MFKYIVLLSLFISSQVYSTDTDEGVLDKISLGVGLGIPYGVLGGNLNFRVIDQVEVFYGTGTWGSSWGARTYPIAVFPRIRFSAFHGVNTILSSCQDDSCDIIEDSYSGWNLAVGIAPDVGDDGWEFDLIYILTQDNYQDDLDEAREAGFDIEEENGVFQASLGYRWNF